jgi:endoglucanase
MKARKLSFTYHSYHEDAFGLYRGGGQLPDPANANTALIDLFTKKLKK